MPGRIVITPGESFNSLTIIREVEKVKAGKELRRAVEVECTCGHIFIVRYNAVKTGSTTSCGCLKTRYVTAANRNNYLKELFTGTKLKRNNSSEILNGKDKVSLLCECGCVWEKEFNLIVSRKVNCPDCLKQERLGSNTDYRDRVTEKLSNTSLSLNQELTKKLRLTDTISLKCIKNSCVFTRRVDVILGYNYGCPCLSSSGFKSTSSAILYLLELKDVDGFTTSYKYGITNNFPQRLQQLKRKYPNNLEPFYTWEYEFGYTANKHERAIKHALVPAHNKLSMPDGYTETFGKEMLSAFLAIQKSQYETGVYY